VKLIAGLPLALVLVSLCGAATPAFNATVSGHLFWDTNLNGVRDECDRPITNRALALDRDDGEHLAANVDKDGSFTFVDIEGGDYTLIPQVQENYLWPITTDPVNISLKGWEDVDGIEIGSAGASPLVAERHQLVVATFDDVNLDGVADPGECGVESASVVNLDLGQPFNGSLGQVSPGFFTATLQLSRPYPVLVNAYDEISFWSQTTPSVDGACFREVMPEKRWGQHIYAASVGLALAAGDGQIGGYIFEDADADGLYDSSAESTRRAPVIVEPVCDGEPTGRRITVDAYNGEFLVSHLLPGEYRLYTPGVSYTEDKTGVLYAPTTPAADTIHVGDRATRVDFGFREASPASLIIAPFDDRDRDGVRSAEEGTAWRASACATLLLAQEFGPVSCASPRSDGLIHFESLLPGDLAVEIFLTLPNPAGSATQLITLADGETREVDVPFDVPAELRVPLDPALASSIPWDVCAADPNWVQPPEDNQPAELQNLGLDVAHAHEAYGRHAYVTRLGSASPTIIASELATASAYVDCDLDVGVHSDRREFVFINYQPTAVFQNRDLLEIHVMPAASGWLTMTADYTQPLDGYIGSAYIVNDSTGEVFLPCGEYACDENSNGSIYPHIGPGNLRID